jgi:ribose transport system substrate-binding protein
MKKASWILALVFGLAFVGATLMNAALVGEARSALAGGTLPAPGPATARFHLVLVVPDTDDSFFAGLIEGVHKAAPLSGAAVQVFKYPGSSPSEAERYFEIALRAKVDGLIMFTPRDYRGEPPGRNRGEEAARNGVVFISVGTDAPAGEKGPFIGSGSLLQGIEGGKLIGRNLGASARVGLILSSPSGSSADDPLYDGVRSALASFPGARIIAIAVAQPGILSGEAVAESMLRANPTINAVLCSNARDTVGAAQVLVDRSEVGRVLIIGSDETPDIQRYIDRGVVAASVVRDSRRIGEEAVRAFSTLRGGGRMPGPVETGFIVIRMKDRPR